MSPWVAGGEPGRQVREPERPRLAPAAVGGGSPVAGEHPGTGARRARCTDGSDWRYDTELGIPGELHRRRADDHDRRDRIGRPGDAWTDERRALISETMCSLFMGPLSERRELERAAVP